MNKRDRMKAAIEQQRAEKASFLRRELAKGKITQAEFDKKIKDYC